MDDTDRALAEYHRRLDAIREARRRGEDTTAGQKELVEFMVRHRLGEGRGMPTTPDGDPM